MLDPGQALQKPVHTKAVSNNLRSSGGTRQDTSTDALHRLSTKQYRCLHVDITGREDHLSIKVRYRFDGTGAYAAVTSICVTRHATMSDPNRSKFCVSSLIFFGAFGGVFFLLMALLFCVSIVRFQHLLEASNNYNQQAEQLHELASMLSMSSRWQLLITNAFDKKLTACTKP